jgi:hypothetical protein
MGPLWKRSEAALILFSVNRFKHYYLKLVPWLPVARPMPPVTRFS